MKTFITPDYFNAQTAKALGLDSNGAVDFIVVAPDKHDIAQVVGARGFIPAVCVSVAGKARLARDVRTASLRRAGAISTTEPGLYAVAASERADRVVRFDRDGGVTLVARIEDSEGVPVIHTV